MQNDELPILRNLFFCIKRHKISKGFLRKIIILGKMSPISCTASSCRSIFIAIFICSNACCIYTNAQTTLPESRELKKLSVEELMNIEVISVSKSPEKLTEVPSAIQVITGEDVYRSAYTSLPEALRLASNLQVAKTNSHDWAISSRGFNAAQLSNNTLSNKLLVMIDGRSVYTPLFGGVFWDVQNVLLEDLSRIEVVSGPGGTLWGANAVNGVINVITKTAKETQGLFLSGSTGSFLKDYAAVRYGTKLAPNLYFRMYEQQFDQGDMKLKNGNDANDGWTMTQGGFRMDYFPSAKNTFTLHGDIYGGKEENPTNSIENGQNIYGKWTHNFSERSELTINAYFDRTLKDFPVSKITDRLVTYDLDVQHRFRLAPRHNILYGLGFRLMDDNFTNAPSISFNPPDKMLHLINTFAQDQVNIVPHKLELTVGTKLLYNDYSKFEFQPSARLAWLLTPKNTIWAAVSRAVRTPSRFETDEITTALTTPGGYFLSETVVAYELGYRLRPAENVSFSIATYYNIYDNLRSINTNPTPPSNFIFANDQKANSWGVEISGNVIAADWWRLRGGYTYMDKKFTYKSANVLPTASSIEALDPLNQAMIQSIMNLPGHLQLDITGRYVDDIVTPFTTTTSVNAYTTFDVRFAWEHAGYTISLHGQNLASSDHAEFGQRQLPRNVAAKLTIRF